MIDQQENLVRVDRAPARFSIKLRKSRKYFSDVQQIAPTTTRLTRSLKFQISGGLERKLIQIKTRLSRSRGCHAAGQRRCTDSCKHTRLHSLSPSYLSQKCHNRRLWELLDGRQRNYKTSGSNWNTMKSLRMKTTITITRDLFHSLRLCQRVLSPTLTSRPVLADALPHLVWLALS